MTELVTQVSTKDKVLQILAANARPVTDVVELRELWGPFPPPYGDLIKALWGLQKQGEVKFKEHRQGGVSLLTNIRLSRGIDTRVFRANESRGRHRVGKDYTDPASHHWIATGGPIEKIKIPTEVPMNETITHGPKAKDNSQWIAYTARIKPDRVRPILPVIASGIDRPMAIQRELDISSARVTSLVARGEQLGWLTKEQMPTGNGVLLRLTAEGANLAAEPFTEPPRNKVGRQKGFKLVKQADTPQGYVAPIEGDARYTDPDDYRTQARADSELDDEARLDVESPDWPGDPKDRMPEPSILDKPRPTRPARIIFAVEGSKYPLISELMTKEDRLAAYEAAAKLLEGFDADLALSLLEKIQLTPLETEVIAFVRSLR